MYRSVCITAAIAAALTGAIMPAAMSSAFTGGSVTAIAPDDVLNIRKWPSAQSQIIDGYELDEPISLTGRCKNIVTNVSFRIDGGEAPGHKYAMMKRANVWCQVMTNDAVLGWARGKYIWPE